jgi:hypothetical protein
MATVTVTGPLAAITLEGGAMVQLEAINPATGAEVSGVKATNMAVYGDDLAVNTAPLEDYVPLLLSQQV